MARYGALAAFILSGFAQIAVPNLAAAPVTPPGFAVVELFTSEGCSSCPPADGALSSLIREADQQKLPVYALEWHVDYWDYLGWKDPWDSRLATERQYAYSRALPSSVYTPQAVINGYIVPGYAGDLQELMADARKAAAEPQKSSLSVAVQQASPTVLKVSVKVADAPRGSEVLVAEIEGDLKATPIAGENAGRALVHSSVVRSARVIPAADREIALDVPPATPGTTRRVIALLQSSSTLRILAAAQVELSAASGALSGRVMDASGRPLAGVRVSACSGKLCVPGETGKDGYFELSGLAPGSYEIDFNSPLTASVQYVQHPDGITIMKTVWQTK